MSTIVSCNAVATFDGIGTLAKGTRITLTAKQCESPTGKRLIDLILSMCHDGELDLAEVADLHAYLLRDQSEIAAVEFLRALTREVLADGALSAAEAHRLKLAFERVVPKEVRGIISTHLEKIGAPNAVRSAGSSAWELDPATSRQIDYIIDLGGTIMPGMTKGEASNLIEDLLERRPPTPRQRMLLRFFDRLDLARSTKDEVSEWVDHLFMQDERHERAWERFKMETRHDPGCQNPTVVPVGAYRNYMVSRLGY